jgi:hypothetical protein
LSDSRGATTGVRAPQGPKIGTAALSDRWPLVEHQSDPTLEAAADLVSRYGENASLIAAERVQCMVQSGDAIGAVVWMIVVDLVGELHGIPPRAKRH